MWRVIAWLPSMWCLRIAAKKIGSVVLTEVVSLLTEHRSRPTAVPNRILPLSLGSTPAKAPSTNTTTRIATTAPTMVSRPLRAGRGVTTLDAEVIQALVGTSAGSSGGITAPCIMPIDGGTYAGASWSASGSIEPESISGAGVSVDSSGRAGVGAGVTAGCAGASANGCQRGISG